MYPRSEKLKLCLPRLGPVIRTLVVVAMAILRAGAINISNGDWEVWLLLM